MDKKIRATHLTPDRNIISFFNVRNSILGYIDIDADPVLAMSIANKINEALKPKTEGEEDDTISTK